MNITNVVDCERFVTSNIGRFRIMSRSLQLNRNGNPYMHINDVVEFNEGIMTKAGKFPSDLRRRINANISMNSETTIQLIEN